MGDATYEYSKFLKYLQPPHYKSSPCLNQLHPRNWVPPPCLTTKQKAVPFSSRQSCIKEAYSRSYSSPDLSVDKDSSMDSTDSSEDSSSCNSNEYIKATKREWKIILNALKKYDLGETLPSTTKHIVKKWQNKGATKQPAQKLQKHSKKVVGEREHLIRPMTNKIKGSMVDQEKDILKYQSKQLNNKEKVKGNNTNKQKWGNGHCVCGDLQGKKNKLDCSSSYKYIALKRKYKDLREHLLKIEEDNKVLMKENNALHNAGKERESGSHFQDKISNLEKEVFKLNSYVSKYKGENKLLCKIKEENQMLKAQYQQLKIELAKENELPLSIEIDLKQKLNETKMFYEKAIDGYKYELGLSNNKIKAFTDERASFANQWEKKEVMIQESFVSEIKELNERLSSELCKIEYLEKCLHEKESEVRKLKESVKNVKVHKNTETVKSDNFEKQVMGRFEELLTQSGSGLSTADKATLVNSIKETVNQCFNELKQFNKDGQSSYENYKKLLSENQKLQDCLKEKILEAQITKEELKKSKEELEIIYARLESKDHVDSKLSEGLDALKQFPELIKHTEEKLSLSDELQKKLVIENRLLLERLEMSQDKVLMSTEQVKSCEEQLSKQNECNRSLEKEIEKMQTKIHNLQSSVERKDEILERNSTQLEERIRACAALNAQIEKLKEEHSQEVSSLKLKSTTHDSHCHSKLTELQSEKSKLESELALIKNEKSNQERTLKKQIHTLKDEVDQLLFKNRTYQRQLDTISSTYKSLFSSTEETCFDQRNNQRTGFFSEE